MSLILLKTLTRNLILPPASIALLGILGFLLLKRRPALARVFLALSLVSLWLLSVPLIADRLLRLAEHYPALDLSQATGAQAIVVLGGGGQMIWAPEYEGPMARPILLERLTYAAYAARKTGLPILVSGARVESMAMHETLQRNFDTPVRWVDDQAGDTFQNARDSVRLLKDDGIERILLVTSSSHMVRSVHEFTSAGIQVVAAPTGLAAARDDGVESYFPSPGALLDSYTALDELLGDKVRAFFAFSHLRRH